MAAIAVAAIAAGAGIVGDVMSQQGQQATNQATMGMQMQAENWMGMMSDTSMQRRVADLKAAGLNPMLAVGQGGASTPGISTPNLQNPSSAFGNLGNQMSNAMQTGANVAQTQSQVSLNSAQAASQQADAALKQATAAKMAGVDTDVARQNIQESQVRMVTLAAQAEASKASAMLDQAQARVADAQLPKIQAEIANIGASQSLSEAQTHVANLAAQLSQLNITQFKALSPELITSATNAARQSGVDILTAIANQQKALKEGQMYAGDAGTAITYLNAFANWFHLGANISSSSSTVTRQ